MIKFFFIGMLRDLTPFSAGADKPTLSLHEIAFFEQNLSKY